MSDPRFDGKIVLITGSTSGIGEACARRFSTEGARLILVGRRSERLARQSAELATDVCEVELDVRDGEAVRKKLGSLPEEWQSIDLLVNNAGLSRGLDPIQSGDLNDWNEMIDTNVKGLLYVSRAIIPGMVARGNGHVINIGSIAGREVYPSGNVYCATKHAVDALTKGMRIDLIDTPVKVSTVDPGMVETEFSEVRFRGNEARAAKVYEGFQPLVGDDIADAVYWVASRPSHVQIAEMVVFPAAQASATRVRRK